MTSRSELSRGSRIGLPIAGTVVGIGLWWLLTVVFDIRTLFLPSPPDVVDAFFREPSYLFTETWATLWATITGFAIAAVAGLLGGMLLTSSRIVEQATLPMIVAFNAVPKVSLVPLLIVWVDYGPRMRISLVVLIAFFPILVSTMAGLTSTPAELTELTRSLSASRLKTYLKVRLPWALPQLFVGMKVGITLALIGAVVAEIQSPNAGLGSIITASGQSADTSLAFAAITLLAVLGVGLFYLVVAAERLAVPWARQISA
ncbi:ABC transporter permease [Plantactinospora soyae]|uniref:NitT/TauT family transport system permease protein n=1 Tax=Plantactinospora soyae TaxID=1544732 RepID=A0A927R4L7_9ACTN|nr:ABC transporter permease [Plantactinospora soyae]MBE1485101.1 NitT/TauT family transport system permease protein [Plantactinospora soyae]